MSKQRGVRRALARFQLEIEKMLNSLAENSCLSRERCSGVELRSALRRKAEFEPVTLAPALAHP